MQNKPKLVKTQSQVQKQLHPKKENQGNARFLMGLNNRAVKLDKRMENIEAHIAHLHDQRIGYRELALTLVLAILIFTSATLAIRELLPSNQNPSLEQQLLTLLNNGTIPDKKAALNLLSNLSHDGEAKNWLRTQESVNTPSSAKYRWPLEKQTDSERIQYSQHKHGIHIATQLGDPVVAIAKGKVLYSGNAIAGYGNLILIQHEQHVISVYGNNYSNYAKEGQTVQAGDLIAAAGETQGHTANLYFEIRFRGKAEDPFLYFSQAL